MTIERRLPAGTGSSVVVTRCQICQHQHLRSVLFIGYLPPVNEMRPLGERASEETFYAAEFADRIPGASPVIAR